MKKPIYSHKIDQHDLDYTQRTSMTAVIKYLLTTAGQDADSHKFGVSNIIEDNHTWVLSRLSVEFIKIPQRDETLNIQTWVSCVDRLFSTRNFYVANQQGEHIASATSKWSMIDLATRRPINIATLGIKCVDDTMLLEPPRRIDTSEVTLTSQHKVMYSDIDFNRHVNTLRYIELMLNHLPVEVIDRDGGVRLDIHFVSESKIGELLNIKCSNAAHSHTFEITHADDTSSIKSQFTCTASTSSSL